LIDCQDSDRSINQSTDGRKCSPNHLITQFKYYSPAEGRALPHAAGDELEGARLDHLACYDFLGDGVLS
jgi:hypothetical protein